MDRIEYNAITFRHEQGGATLPLRLAFLRTAHWTAEGPAHYIHDGAGVAYNRLFLFRRGGCRILWQGQEHRLSSGRIYLLPIGGAFEVDYLGGCEIFAFHFHMATSTGRDVFRASGGIRHLDDQRLFDELVVGVENATIEGTLRWQSALFQAVCRFCGPLMEAIFEKEKQSRDFKELLEYIQRQPAPSLTIAHLARRMGMSRAALSKSFSRVMGQPLKSHLTQTAMRKAEELVLRQDLTVQQIAAQLGYNDPFYFHRVFKKHTGLTPLEFRRRARMYG